MRLEVYLDETLVGWLETELGRRRFVVTKTTADPKWVDDGSTPPYHQEHRSLTLKTRGVTLDEWEIQAARDLQALMKSRGIPENAQRFRSEAKRAETFEWKVVSVDADDYEWLFDHDKFTPADSRVDHDSYIERRLPYFAGAFEAMQPKPRELERQPEERAMAKILKCDVNIALSPILTDDDLAALAALDAA